MNKIDKNYFFDKYPFKLTARKRDNLNFLIDKFDESEKFSRLSYFACALGNMKVETFDTFEPKVEGFYLSEKVRVNALYKYYKKNNPKALSSIFPNGPEGIAFYGRGYIQVTHNFNYQKFIPLVKAKYPDIDLMKHPEMACQPNIAWLIMEEGMTRDTHTFRDVNFTGYTLEQFFNDQKHDWLGSRRIINGKDRANEIASYSKSFYNALRYETGGL